jgi:15-cis-phytoene synthase
MLLTSTDTAMRDSVHADLHDCRDRLRVGSRSFHAAAFLLPRSFREPASALYAFCRAADDAIDESDDAHAALHRMHRRLDGIYCGRPEDCAADRALAEVVATFDLPKALLEALFEGFAWDVEGRRYADLSGVIAYSARVAGSVGTMMAILMGVREPHLLARASDLGVAMQLTNIARDVGEDARAGRLYLPQDWLDQAGIDSQAFLSDPRFSAALGGVVERLLHEASRLYARADSGIAHLPRRCRPAIHAARLLYAEIGLEVARRGFDSVSQRAVVAAQRKARVLTIGLPQLALMPDSLLHESVLPETRFLVAAAAAEPSAGMVNAALRMGLIARIENRFVWVLDLFEELDRRERQRAAPSQLADESVV